MVESKKLLKIRNPKIELIACTNFKFEKKKCISYSRLRRVDLNRSFNRSRWVFSPKYISFIHSWSEKAFKSTV